MITTAFAPPGYRVVRNLGVARRLTVRARAHGCAHRYGTAVQVEPARADP